MAKKTQVEVAATLSMDRESFEKIQELIEGDAQPAQKVAMVCNGLLADMASGGMMLSGSDMQRIRECVPEADTVAIIEAVEASSGIDAGQVVVRWRVDPSLVQPLQDIADQQGMSVDEVTQNLMDTAVNQGWFYQFNPQPHSIFMDHADYVRLAAVVGKEQFTGADLISFLTEKGVLESTETLSEFLGSLEEGETEGVPVG